MHHRARLTAEQVRKIRKLHAEGVSQGALARRFDVTQATIYQIVHGDTWRHLLPPTDEAPK